MSTMAPENKRTRWIAAGWGLTVLGWIVTGVLSYCVFQQNEKRDNYEAFRAGLDQVLAVKADHVLLPSVIEASIAAPDNTLFAAACPPGMEPRVFIALCSHFYRFESIWVARREGRLPDGMWPSFQREMELYLDAPAYWKVFIRHEQADSGLLDDFTKAIAYFYIKSHRKEETGVVPHSFPDPLHLPVDFESWVLPSDFQDEPGRLDEIIRKYRDGRDGRLPVSQPALLPTGAGASSPSSP